MTEDALLRIANMYYPDNLIERLAFQKEMSVDGLTHFVVHCLRQVCKRSASDEVHLYIAALRIGSSATQLRDVAKGFDKAKLLRSTIKDLLGQPWKEALTDEHLCDIANNHYPKNVIDYHARHRDAKKDYLARYVVDDFDGIGDSYDTDEKRLDAAKSYLESSAEELDDLEGGLREALMMYGTQRDCDIVAELIKEPVAVALG